MTEQNPQPPRWKIPKLPRGWTHFTQAALWVILAVLLKKFTGEDVTKWPPDA